MFIKTNNKVFNEPFEKGLSKLSKGECYCFTCSEIMKESEYQKHAETEQHLNQWKIILKQQKIKYI